MCAFLFGIHHHRGPVWSADITLATRIARIILRVVWRQQVSNRWILRARNRNAAAIDKARAWETARRQASNIAQGEGGQSNVNMVKAGRDSKELSSGFGTHKCYACGKVGHFARDKVCPARGKTCAKCGEKGHWAACCRREAESKKGGRARGKKGGKQRGPSDKRVDSKSGNSRVNQVEYDSGDEPYAFPINFNGGKACEDI